MSDRMEQSHPEPKPFEYDGGYEQGIRRSIQGTTGAIQATWAERTEMARSNPGRSAEFEREIQRGEFDGYRAHGDAWLEE